MKYQTIEHLAACDMIILYSFEKEVNESGPYSSSSYHTIVIPLYLVFATPAAGFYYCTVSISKKTHQNFLEKIK